MREQYLSYIYSPFAIQLALFDIQPIHPANEPMMRSLNGDVNEDEYRLH